MVDALGSRGDEGRTRLRKATRSCQEALMSRYPNGETQCVVMRITFNGANLAKWNISVARGKEIKRDSPSSGERTGKRANRVLAFGVEDCNIHLNIEAEGLGKVCYKGW